MSEFVPVIICGGEGKRLWPLSSKKKPKQFIPMFDSKSLFELPLLRLKEINLPKNISQHLTKKDISIMIDIALLMERPLKNALGDEWKKIIQNMDLESLYKKM